MHENTYKNSDIDILLYKFYAATSKSYTYRDSQHGDSCTVNPKYLVMIYSDGNPGLTLKV